MLLAWLVQPLGNPHFFFTQPNCVLVGCYKFRETQGGIYMLYLF